MLLKLLAFVFVALVFIGLGSSGTLGAAFAGYHTVTSNPLVQQIQNKATSVITGAANQFHHMENTAAHTISSKV